MRVPPNSIVVLVSVTLAFPAALLNKRTNRNATKLLAKIARMGEASKSLRVSEDKNQIGRAAAMTEEAGKERIARTVQVLLLWLLLYWGWEYSLQVSDTANSGIRRAVFSAPCRCCCCMGWGWECSLEASDTRLVGSEE